MKTSEQYWNEFLDCLGCIYLDDDDKTHCEKCKNRSEYEEHEPLWEEQYTQVNGGYPKDIFRKR